MEGGRPSSLTLEDDQAYIIDQLDGNISLDNILDIKFVTWRFLTLPIWFDILRVCFIRGPL